MSDPNDHRLNLAAVLSRNTALHPMQRGLSRCRYRGAERTKRAHQVRYCAAEALALGLLGAFDVLEEFLRKLRNGDDGRKAEG